MTEDGVAAGRRIAKLLGGEEFSPAGVRLGIDRRVAIAVAVAAVVALGVIGFLALRPGPSVEPVAVPGGSGSVVPTGSGGGVFGVPGAAVAPGGASPGGTGTVPGLAVSGGPSISVYVVGQVRRPGVVSVPTGARVVDAVDAAGGATRRADMTAVNLARKVADGEQILVPEPGQAVAAAPVAGSSVPDAAGAAGGAGAPGQPVNLNTATEAELDALPGVGPVIAGKIVAWRTENGHFATVDDLTQVSGIGDATMARLRPLVTV